MKKIVNIDKSKFEIFNIIKNIVNNFSVIKLPSVRLVDPAGVSSNCINYNQRNNIIAIFSYLKVIRKLSEKHFDQLNNIGTPLYKFKVSKYKLVPQNKLNNKVKINHELIENMNEIRKIFKLEVYETLSKQVVEEHSIGECNDDYNACSYCSTWYLWKVINQKLKYKIDYIKIKRDFNRSKNLHLNNYLGKYNNDFPSFKSHIIIENEDNSNLNEVRYIIPNELQIFLYKIEMIISLIHTYKYIQIFKKLNIEKSQRVCKLNCVSKF